MKVLHQSSKTDHIRTPPPPRLYVRLTDRLAIVDVTLVYLLVNAALFMNTIVNDVFLLYF